MIREVCIIVLASCCIFSVIPLIWVFSNVLSFLLPGVFLLVVLSYAGYDAKKLAKDGEQALLWIFIVLLIATLALSMIAVYYILPYTLPRLVA
jgi:hypothetical protein